MYQLAKEVFISMGAIKGQSLHNFSFLLPQLRSIMMLILTEIVSWAYGFHSWNLYLLDWRVSDTSTHFTVAVLNVVICLFSQHTHTGSVFLTFCGFYCLSSTHSHMDVDICYGTVPNVCLWLNGCCVGKGCPTALCRVSITL